MQQIVIKSNRISKQSLKSQKTQDISIDFKTNFEDTMIHESMKYREINEFKGDVYEHLSEKNQITSVKITNVNRSTNTVLQKIGIFLKNAFLPQGYPDSVSDDYLSYQVWDTVQAFASSISGSLATQVSTINFIFKIFHCWVKFGQL